jgi:ATP-binding cassette subfamily B protein
MPRLVATSPDDGPTPRHLEGAWAVLVRGLRESPELKAGALYTLALAMVSALGSLLLPVLIQQILDHGVTGPMRARLGFIATVCALAALATVLVYLAGRAAYSRLVTRSERALRELRVRVFEHIHSLSIAEQTAERRGVFVARVTADVDALGRFMEWAAISWVTGSALIAGTAVAMFVYSWQLALVTFASVAPLGLVLRVLQRHLLSSYDQVRTRVGETLAEISESVMGADVVKAYDLDRRMDRRLRGAIERQYRAQMRAMRFQAMVFPSGHLFGGFAAAAVLAVGVTWGPAWGLSAGRLVAFTFLVTILVQPMAEMAENFDQTQTAIAGWRKVLALLSIPSGPIEPTSGQNLPAGALSVEARGVEFSYSDATPVLRGVSLRVHPGAHVAIVGETGCGKTTFAKLLCRLADPISGEILVGGVDLRAVAPESRRAAIRMVPQDGFLFEGTVAANVAYGREGASREDVRTAFATLGLSEWVGGLPDGLDTNVGQRGESLSVGEAQLVSLARAHIGRPAVLILDEATSAVDPETERALGQALERVSEGRTTITIAHRLSTAERADWVFVFDAGRLVESGTHASLAAANGRYASLYRSWLGNTRLSALTRGRETSAPGAGTGTARSRS